MTDRPTIFSAPMVQALLEGRKTQTRRVLKTQPPEDAPLVGIYAPGLTAVFNPAGKSSAFDADADVKVRALYAPGDRLWVREAWQYAPSRYCRCPQGGSPSPCDDWIEGTGCRSDRSNGLIYRADDAMRPANWRSQIHMPRMASRLTLTVTDVRVERVQEISEADAIAEGAPPSHPSIDKISREFGSPDFSRSWYAQLFDRINGAGSWDADPWVWAITFEVERRNIDEEPQP